MNLNWGKRARQMGIPCAEDREAAWDVIIEYDGPHLVVYRSKVDKSRTRVGIFAESDDKHDRWLVAHVTKLELESLAVGALPMRDVFSRKSHLRAIDYDSKGKPASAVDIAIGDVPSGILPVRGASLPSASQQLLQKLIKLRPARSRYPRFRFAGLPVHGTHIELAALAQLAQSIQNLWTAIGQSLHVFSIRPDDDVPTTALMAGATSGGSYVVEIHPSDVGVFETIVAEYQNLIGIAHNDISELQRTTEGNVDLRRRMIEYFGILDSLQAETLIETPKTRAYVSHSNVKVISAALRLTCKKASTSDIEQVETEHVTFRGYFDEFGLPERTFTFYDLDRDERVKGHVDGALAKRIEGPDGQEATVGRITRYKVTVRSKGNDYILVDFEPIGRTRLPFPE